MAKLADILSTRSPGDIRGFEERLRALGSYRGTTFQAHENILLESRFEPAAWNDFISSLLATAVAPVEIQRAAREVFRRWILKGGEIGLPESTVFGRAVTQDALVSLVRKKSPGRARSRAWKEVRDLCVKPFALVKRRWSRRDLGMHLMWATFDPRGGRPFDGLPGTADGLRRILGLDPNLRGKPIILMEYRLGGDAKPLFPTIADAYAGDEWPYFFRPAPEGFGSGRIMCWPDYARQTVPRPEVVHDVVTGERLCVQPKRVL